MSARRVVRPAVLRGIPLDRHAVIEASAGTGKTFTLEHLVVELVLSTDVPIDRILVVTFTEKATNELRAARAAPSSRSCSRAGRAEPDEAQVRRRGLLDPRRRARRARLAARAPRLRRRDHRDDPRVLPARPARERLRAAAGSSRSSRSTAATRSARAMRDALRGDVAPRSGAGARGSRRRCAAGWSIGRIEELLWNCVQAQGELRPGLRSRGARRGPRGVPRGRGARADGPRRDASAWGMHAPTASKVGSALSDLALARRERRATPADAPRSCRPARRRTRRVSSAKAAAPLLPRPGPTRRACAAALDAHARTPSLPAASRTLLRARARASSRGASARRASTTSTTCWRSSTTPCAGRAAGALAAAMRAALALRAHRRVPGHRRDAVVDLPPRVLRARRPGAARACCLRGRPEAVHLPLPRRGRGDLPRRERRGARGPAARACASTTTTARRPRSSRRRTPSSTTTRRTAPFFTGEHRATRRSPAAAPSARWSTARAAP